MNYGFFQTPLGIVLVAATENGLCSLRIGTADSAEQKLAELRQDHPGAAMMEETAAVQRYADPLMAYLEGREKNFAPHLEFLSGTAWQRMVWAELQRIPPGQTLSYTEVAARVGRPAAVRAVGSACAANEIAIAVPCHRVRRQDGSLAGYRWGLDWKQRLLDLETGQHP
ncbi:MAG: methylated-DNA--[protein]-cysteine S-methyltransferase [Armatimonadota bacterium]|nr:methylated-DNA--[protein]-cysteine S-methyltransferase [Armatimonadota bacterium]